jgi:acyl-CoA synthetase (AMP-forming)/AMP-acid ligase II
MFGSSFQLWQPWKQNSHFNDAFTLVWLHGGFVVFSRNAFMSRIVAGSIEVYGTMLLI